jgi:hypothetical protein
MENSLNHVKYLIVLGLAAACASPAFADEAEGSQNGQPELQSPTTRAQVNAELQAYRHAGINPWASAYNPLRQFRSERTRAQVRAELVQAREEAAAMTAEDSGSAYLARARVVPPAPATLLAGQAPFVH